MIYNGKYKKEDVYLALKSLGGGAENTTLYNELRETVSDKWKEDLKKRGSYSQILWHHHIRGHLDALRKEGRVRNPRREYWEIIIKEEYDIRDFFVMKNEDISFREGKKEITAHWKYERNSNAVKIRKQMMMDKNGKLSCSICNFSFEDFYGEIGRNIIDIHHIIPLSEFDLERDTTMEDIIPLCSNCHRIIHSKRQFVSIEDMRKIIKNSQ